MGKKISLYLALWSSVLLGGLQAAVLFQEDAGARNRVIQQFLREAPEVGEPLPDVQIFDADGRPFSLSQLKGHYTVLVFGCLT